METLRNRLKTALMRLVALVSVLVVGYQKLEEANGNMGTQQSQSQAGS